MESQRIKSQTYSEHPKEGSAIADASTISRIGGLLKPTFEEGVKEQQQLTVDIRNRIGKPSKSAWKAPGQYFEISARVGGNRAGIKPSQSDSATPTASRQKEVKWQVFERGYMGKIQMYEKDILNTNQGEFQAYMDHQTDEVKGITKDFLKIANIDISAGDGSGVLSLINAGTTASTTATLQVGTGSFQYGSLYLQQGDEIDVYDSTLTTSRSSGAGVIVNSITPSTGGGAATITMSSALTLTTGDVVVRGGGRVNMSYVGPLGMLRNQGITFQNLSTTTYPILAANRINLAGAPLTESTLQSLEDVVMRNSGEEIVEYWAGLAQWAAYLQTGTSQKRFMDMEMDKGFTTLKYNGHKFVKMIDIPSAVLMCLNIDTIKFGAIAPWGPSELDDSFLKPVPGFQAYYANFREWGNFIYERPNACALADGLAYNTSNPAYAK